MNSFNLEKERLEAYAAKEGKKLLVCETVHPLGKESVWTDAAKDLIDSVEIVREKIGAEKALILCKGDGKAFEDAAAGKAIEVRAADNVEYGMPFMAPTAVGRYLNGEQGYPCLDKPICTPDGELVCAFIPSAIVRLSEKLPEAREFFVNDTNKVTVKQGQTWAEVAAAGGVAEARGVIAGFPDFDVFGEDELAQSFDIWSLEGDEIEAFDANTCITDVALKLITQCNDQTCGRCIFCREGTLQIKLTIQDIQNGKANMESYNLAVNLAKQMVHQTLCGVGTQAGKLFLELADKFGKELEDHITSKDCKALSCKKYITYHVLQNLCTGCGKCVDACDEDAIDGKPRFIHVISKIDCTKCGNCVSACPEGAIVKAGKIKPPGPMRPIPCRRKD
ncbi:MAG: 4Fe-4S binding protein [Lachnospiraceae bacterium]|nr:4Fe-4S binding protein [Lachnospiraceae bacterium]